MTYKKIIAAGLTLLMLIGVPATGADISNFPSVASMALLRKKHPLQEPAVFLTQYNSTTKKGGGAFQYTGSASCSDDSGVLIQAVGGCYKRVTGGQPYDITWFGALCGGVQVTNGVTNSSTTVTSVSNPWTSSMVGWVAVVNAGAASSKQLVTTVASYNSAGSIVLGTTAGVTGTGKTISVYKDDTTAIAAAITAANTDKTDVALPSGQTCGFANPGSLGSYNFTFASSLRLNNGTLWMGQTGAVSNTGVQLSWNGSKGGVIGPGTVDGLYQTNQVISQTTADMLVFNGGDRNFIRDNVVIQNSKGRAFVANSTSNFSVSDVTAQNCGDFEYVPGGGDPQAGRSMCGQIDSDTGNSFINNYRSLNAAQSGILISAVSVPTAGTLGSATISNMFCKDAGYFCVDIEAYPGSVHLSNIFTTATTGATHTANKLYAGYIFRDVGAITAVNLVSKNIDSNAMSAQMTGNSREWLFTNTVIEGTSASHTGAAAFTMPNGRQRLSLDGFVFDYMSIYMNSADACVTNFSQRALFQFRGLKATHLYPGTYDFTFNPQGNASTFFFVQGADSDLGVVEINSLSSATNAVLYDLFRVQMQGALTFTGATGSASYGGTTWTNPLELFTCP